MRNQTETPSTCYCWSYLNAPPFPNLSGWGEGGDTPHTPSSKSILDPPLCHPRAGPHVTTQLGHTISSKTPTCLELLRGKSRYTLILKGTAPWTCLAMHLTCMKYRIVLEGPRRFPGASSDGRHPSPSEQPHVQISFANQLASPGFELYSCGIAESICPPVPDSFCSKFQTCLWASHDLGEIPCLRMGLCLLFTLTSFQNSSHNIPRPLPGPGFRHIP